MRFVSTLAFAALAAGLVPAGLDAQAASPKIVFIRSEAVLQAAPARTDAEQQFDKDMQGYRAEIQRMADSLQQQIEGYRKVQNTLTAAQREQRENTLRQRQEEYGRRQQQIEFQAQQRQAALMQPITDQIRTLLEEMRAAEGWTMVLDLDANGGGVVAYDKNLDVTDRVASRLRTLPKPTLPTTAAAQQPPAPRPQGSAGPVAAPAGVGRPKPPTE